MKASLLCTLVMITFSACSHDTPGHGNAPGSNATPGRMEPARAPSFSGTRAFELLKKQTAFGPRNPNSTGHQQCLAFLIQTLRNATVQVRLQSFSHKGYAGEDLDLTNVVASFKPEAQTRVLLCAHWDTRPRADQDPDRKRHGDPILGANDGASGVAVLLELASLFKETPPPVGVDLALFDGEDYGKEGDEENYLLGSRYFADTRPPDYLPKFGILLDMVGDRYLDLPREQYSVQFAPDVVDLVWNTARQLRIQQFSDAEGEAILDDHIPLNRAGIKTIDIIDFNYPDPTNRFWHTHQDVPENCSAESLEAVGAVLAHVVYGLQP